MDRKTESDEIIDVAEKECVRGDLELETFDIVKNVVIVDSPFFEVAVNSKRHVMKNNHFVDF